MVLTKAHLRIIDKLIFADSPVWNIASSKRGAADIEECLKDGIVEKGSDRFNTYYLTTKARELYKGSVMHKKI